MAFWINSAYSVTLDTCPTSNIRSQTSSECSLHSRRSQSERLPTRTMTDLWVKFPVLLLTLNRHVLATFPFLLFCGRKSKKTVKIDFHLVNIEGILNFIKQGGTVLLHGLHEHDQTQTFCVILYRDMASTFPPCSVCLTSWTRSGTPCSVFS